MDKVKSFFKNHYKKLLIGIVIIGVLLFLKNKFLGGDKSNTATISSAEFTTLKKGDFVNSVQESGNAKSETSQEIYAEKMLPVKDINIEVGDKVKQGDVIATLESSSINQQIDQLHAQIASTNKSAGASVSNAKSKLSEAERNLNDGTNANIVSAEHNVQNAYEAWQNAQKAYENFKNSFDEGYNDQIAAQDANAENLENVDRTNELNLHLAQKNLDDLRYQASENRELANRKQDELDRLKSREERLNSRISQLKRDIEDYSTRNDFVIDSQRISSIQSQIAQLENQLIFAPDTHDTESENPQERVLTKDEIKEQINELEKELKSLQDAPSDDVERMKKDLEIAERELKDISTDIANVSGDVEKYKAKADAARDSLSSGENQYDQALNQKEIGEKNISDYQTQREKSERSMNDQLENLRKAAEDAKNTYDRALKNLDVSKIMANDEINSLKNNLNMAKASGDNSVSYSTLKYLNEDLNKTIIKSPIDGTVTEVNMTKGKEPTTYVAKIETTNKIVIETQVSEFDVNKIKTGMKVEVRSDAVGKEKLADGEVSFIDPVPSLNAKNSSDVTYNVKVILSQDVKEIKPGMNVKIKYILDERKNVFTVPSNAVYEKNGKHFVMTIPQSGAQIEETEVNVDAENDFEMVISSDKLKEGTYVVTATDMYTPGTKVNIDTSENTDTSLQ